MSLERGDQVTTVDDTVPKDTNGPAQAQDDRTGPRPATGEGNGGSSAGNEAGSAVLTPRLDSLRAARAMLDSRRTEQPSGTAGQRDNGGAGTGSAPSAHDNKSASAPTESSAHEGPGRGPENRGRPADLFRAFRKDVGDVAAHLSEIGDAGKRLSAPADPWPRIRSRADELHDTGAGLIGLAAGVLDHEVVHGTRDSFRSR